MFWLNSVFLSGNIVDNIIIIKLVIGPANAIIALFTHKAVPLLIFLLYSSQCILNSICSPYGVIFIDIGLNPNNIPIIRCPISCMKANNINIAYIFICFVIKYIIAKRNIFKSIFMLIFSFLRSLVDIIHSDLNFRIPLHILGL